MVVQLNELAFLYVRQLPKSEIWDSVFQHLSFSDCACFLAVLKLLQMPSNHLSRMYIMLCYDSCSYKMNVLNIMAP